MKPTFLFFIIFLSVSCGKGPESSVEWIKSQSQQNSLFQNIITLTNPTIPETLFSDSLAFLILPVQASCPACRKKTIDSIMKSYKKLDERHFIIISANGGRKTIRGYFQEQSYDLPTTSGHFLLDTLNFAYKSNLYKDKPTIYYTSNRMVYKKVAAIPATVRDDLSEFFSGQRK